MLKIPAVFSSLCSFEEDCFVSIRLSFFLLRLARLREGIPDMVEKV